MKVQYEDDRLAKGTEVHVAGLGSLVNGEEVELDEEAMQKFESETGQTVADAFKDNPRVKLSGAGSRTTSDDAPAKKEGGE